MSKLHQKFSGIMTFLYSRRLVSSLCLLLAMLFLSGCSLLPFGDDSGSGGTRGTRTYTVRGKTYRPLISAEGFQEEGIASWYGKDFHGKKTANGERYNMHGMTAAHKLLPLGTRVRVTHMNNRRSIIVRVNDRGPFSGNRIIDLSYAGAQQLGLIGTGTARVRVEAMDVVSGARSGDLEGTFYIQIAALSKEGSARELVRRLRSQNLGGRTFYAAGIRLWRVQAGPFTSLTRAEDLAEELAERYEGTFVVAD